jgi:chromosomal replication initiation ATPase DnaA
MTSLTTQLTFIFDHRSALGRDDFLVAPANEAAVAWIDRWPAWPAPGLVLQGPAGSGKTHLASVWRARAGAGLVEGATLTPDAVPLLLEADCQLVVENAQAAPEEPLLHLYNGIAERSGHLVLTATQAPARWGVALADLGSRLNALPVAELGLPDDALIRALLIKLFVERQRPVTAELIDYIALRIERSFAMARAVVAAIDMASLAVQRRITIPLAQKVLEELGATGEGEEP